MIFFQELRFIFQHYEKRKFKIHCQINSYINLYFDILKKVNFGLFLRGRGYYSNTTADI